MKTLSITLTVLLAVVATSIAEAKPRASKAQSDMSAKWSQTLDGIAQNLK